MDNQFTYTYFPKTPVTPTGASMAGTKSSGYHNIPSGFTKLLMSYLNKHKNIRTATQEEYKAAEKRLMDECEKNMDALRNIDPVFFPINIPHYKDEDDAQDIVAHIKCAVSRRYSVPNLPTIAVTDDGYAFPAYKTWQTSQAYSANRVISSNDFLTEDDMVHEMNTILMNMLLSLPPKAVHLCFIDMSCSGFGSQLTSKLDKSICRELITSPEAFRDYLKELKERQINIIQNYGELTKYNEENKRFLFSYEVVILLNYSKGYESFEQDMIPLFRNGYKGGIYFLVLNVKSPAEGRDSIMKYDYTDIRPKGVISKHLPFAEITPIWDNDILRKAAFDYLNNSSMEDMEKQNYRQSNVDVLLYRNYAEGSSKIDVPVGTSADGVANFVFDDESHAHAFILGQSGSGKSVLMHDIISSLILKYAPEDLQLYLLDFKTGGVEFDRYHDVKHSKALLVDNSDIQITLEILRDIQNQMKERGKLFRKEGVSKISEYNKIHENDRLPSVVIIADECHVMFPSRNEKDRRIYNEISEIMSYIAKEGRSQGVHLVLATQNLDGADIPNDIIKNVTDHYLLKCAVSDSEKMVSNSSRITSKLNKGQVYYHHSEQSYQFTSFYHPKEELEDIIQQAIDKAKKCRGNGQFYFSGAQMFQINENTIEVLHKKGRKNPVVTGGLSINLTQEPVSIALKNDFSENILLFGINDQEQVNRTTMNLLVTLAISVKERNLDMDICVIDCLNDDEANYIDVLDAMEEKGLCRIINGRRRGEFLKQMVDAISEERATPTTIFVIGQERFREIKMDMPLEKKDTMDLFGGTNFSNEKKIETYKEALQFILERGSEYGVHTVLQIDKPDKILFNEYSMTQKELFSMFKHLIMLHSDENAASRYISDEIKLENISGEAERLRAYYYSEENDTYALFVPYEMPTHQSINILFN